MSVYDIVTEKILTQLEAGVLPWRKPWTSSNPKNLVSKKEYQGINVLLLSLRGFSSPWWVTFNQAKNLGGRIKAGEKGSMIVFYRMIENKKKRLPTGEFEKFPLFSQWTVFNLEQTEGLEAPDMKEPVLPIEAAEEVSIQYRANNGPRLGKSDKASYIPSMDAVLMPPRDSFTNADLYYSTLFHELAHSTGAESRLNRDGITGSIKYGSNDYSKEELIAELSAAFTCGRLGILRSQEASASYLQGWIKVLRGDKMLIVQAASAAEKATKFIFGEREGAVVTAPESNEVVAA